MKLTNIETYVIKTGEPNLGGLFWFFIKLETDEGIVGWGETAVLYTLLGVEDGFEQNLKDIFEHSLKATLFKPPNVNNVKKPTKAPTME